MEYEIDLRPYAHSVIRRWRLVLIIGVICISLGALFALLWPDSFTATATVFQQPTRSQVTLDERFVTNEDIDAAGRRRGLLTLAESTVIEAALPPEVVKDVVEDGYRFGDIADKQIDIGQ